MTSKGLFGICLMAALPLSISPAYAQMSTQPFSFGSVVGGPINGGGSSAGMSMAGRQAIINEQLFGSQPRAILVGPSGEILNVERGPGNIAIVRQQSDPVIPQFRGGSRGFGFSLGFAGARGGYGYGYGLGYGTSASIDAWVAMAADGWASHTQRTSATSATISSWTNSVLAN